MNLLPCTRSHRPRPWRQHGVTLIELMVGMVIGLLATLVISQVAIVFEGQKRNTTSGSDAQVNGALALQVLQRELQTSGYGVATGGGAGCELRGARGTVLPPWNGQPMVPVRIADGTDGTRGSPDSLFVLLSNKATGSIPIRATSDHRRDETSFFIDAKANVGNDAGDLMVVVPPLPAPGAAFATWCSVFSVSATPNTNTIPHDPATTGNGPWNHDGTSPVFPGISSTAVSYTGANTGPSSHLVNLGTMPYREYSLGLVRSPDGSPQVAGSGSELQWRQVDINTAAWTTPEVLFPQIVNLQSVYGHNTLTAAPGPYRTVDTWNATDPTTPDGWARVIAVRVALVARSNQYEKAEVTTTEPTWDPDGRPETTPVTIKVDHLTDWRHYRYKIFEAVIPLRNMLWQS